MEQYEDRIHMIVTGLFGVGEVISHFMRVPTGWVV